METGHLLHPALTRSLGGNARRLKSRHTIVPAAQLINSSADDNNKALWCLLPIECGVVGGHYETPYFHPRHLNPPPWNGPAKNSGVRLNRLRTGFGRFRSCLDKWGRDVAPSATYECGAEEQTM